jgi:hypothetical protein
MSRRAAEEAGIGPGVLVATLVAFGDDRVGCGDGGGLDGAEPEQAHRQPPPREHSSTTSTADEPYFFRIGYVPQGAALLPGRTAARVHAVKGRRCRLLRDVRLP